MHNFNKEMTGKKAFWDLLRENEKSPRAHCEKYKKCTCLIVKLLMHE